jgi:hypothetical protein
MSTPWATQHDKLMGPYRERVVFGVTETCFLCRLPIEGSARERERGGTYWFVHPGDCPKPERSKKKRAA